MTAYYFSIAALTGLAIGLAGCSSAPVGTDPSLTAVHRDQAQREARRPIAGPDEHDESVIVEADLPVALDPFSTWFAGHGAAEFSRFMTGTSVMHVELAGTAANLELRHDALLGSWRNVGDRRRVVFADGASALEEITSTQLPQRFQYEIWNFTGDTGLYINYAVAEFRFSGNERGTHVRWEYSFRPKGGPDAWFISRFVQRDFLQFMAATLTAMQLQASAEAGMK
jgi:hypothetical protein